MANPQQSAFSFSGAFAPLQSAISNLARRFTMWVLSAGPIPKHLAIIMDGNRRFADRCGIDRKSGHLFGYESLMHTLRDCLALGIKVVTVYAFSIDNFKRSPEEVSALMDLMQEKFETLVGEESVLRDYGVRVRVLGDLSLLPESVRIAAERAMAATRHNNSAVLNLCVAYTSSQEIVHALQIIRDNFVAKVEEFKESTDGVNVEHRTGDRPSQEELAMDFSFVEDRDGTNGWACQDNCHNSDLENKHADVSTKKSIRRRRNGVNGLQEKASTHCCNNRAELATGHLDLDDLTSRDKEVCRPLINGVTLNGAAAMHAGKRLENGSKFTMLNETSRAFCEEMSDSHWPASEVCRNGLLTDKVPDSFQRKVLPINSNNGLVTENIPAKGLFNAILDTVTAEMIEHHLYTSTDPPPDLLLRTSGETRLSNFLLWQTSFSHLIFCKVLWPEFSFRHLFWVVLEYQRAYPSLLEKRRLFGQSLLKSHEGSHL